MIIYRCLISTNQYYFFSPNAIEEIPLAFINSLNMQKEEAIENYLGLPMLGVKIKKFVRISQGQNMGTNTFMEI